MEYDAIVVGGGPAGLTTAFFLKNMDVLLIEEHDRIGYPKHCTGLIGEYTARKFIEITDSSIIDNKYTGIFFHTPKGTYHVESKSKPLAYHVNRPLLEEKLLDKVYSRGHQVLLSIKARPGEGINRIDTKTREYYGGIVVAADGVLSIFKRRLIGVDPSYIVGVQRIYRVSSIDPGDFHVVYHPGIKEFFQWLVPLDTDHVLVGYASYPWRRIDPDHAMNHIAGKAGIVLGGVIESFGGLIPLDKPLRKPVIYDKVFFIGDSASTSKPYTGGGLYAIALLAEKLAKAVIEDDPSIYLREYSKLRRRLIIEYTATRILRSIGLWKPVKLVWKLWRKGVDIGRYYDEHKGLIAEALKNPHLLVETILS